MDIGLAGHDIGIGAELAQVGVVANVGRAHLYHINPATFQTTLVSTLNNPTPAVAEFFGTAVAVSGDLIAISVVGHTGSTDPGEIYVFSAATGNLLRTIPHPVPVANDAMGRSLAFSGPYLIASIHAKNVGSPGAAYVFHPTSGELVATIHNPSPDFIDSFGWDIVTDANHVVISAPNEDTDGPNQGMVYVYDLPFGQAVGTLSATDPDTGETFTYSLTNNADGRFAINGNQIVIADATKLDFEAATSHTVTVLVTDSGGNILSKDFVITVTPENEPPQDIVLSGGSAAESQVRYFHNPTPAANNVFFAYGVEVSENLMIVGRNATSASGQFGSAHIYDRTTGDLVTTLQSPTPEIGDLFGERVAISGNRAVVGERLQGDPNTGAAYVFDATTGALIHTLRPDPADPLAVGREFGTAVAISGNLIAVGSDRNAPGMFQAGAVYLFDAVTGGLLQTILSPSPSAQAFFGGSVSISGSRIVIGSRFDDMGALNAGRAFVYQFDPVTQTAALTATLDNPSPGTNDNFGIDVKVLGNTIAVSARLDDTLAADAGQVYLFNATTGALLRTIDNPAPNANDEFGHGIAITTDSSLSKEWLVVSSQFDNTTGIDSGSVYVFDVATGELITTLANPSPNNGDFFGGFVTASPGSIVVGSTTDDTDGFNFGMVYQFTLPMNVIVGSFTTIDPDAGNTFTYELLDDAGGRFDLDGSNIVVRDASLLDFEIASSHQVTVKVTDSTGFDLALTELSSLDYGLVKESRRKAWRSIR